MSEEEFEEIPEVEFSNPDNLPVEEVVLTVNNGGVIQKIKALDSYWVQKRTLALYTSLPFEESYPEAYKHWLIRTEKFSETLEWMLSLNYHSFWSAALYHPQFMKCLVSFLQQAQPSYLPFHEDEDMLDMYASVRRYVFIVFTRLSTDKESESEWMTKEFMASTWYTKFIFTIPIIWDISLIYGFDNKEHISNIVNSVFATQPTYDSDAAIAIAFVKETFKYIILQVNKDYYSVEPPNLPETFQGFSDIRRPKDVETNTQNPLDMESLKDLVSYLLDTLYTLQGFLGVYSKAVDIYKQSHLVSSIVKLYEHGLPLLYEKLEELSDKSPVYAEIEEDLDTARSQLIDIFRDILAVYKNHILSGGGDLSQNVDSYLTVLLEALAERLLVRDYHTCYKLHEDLEMLKQIYPKIDTVKTDFILQAISSNDTDSSSESSDEDITNGNSESPETSESHNITPGPSGVTQETVIPQQVKEESLIIEVKDILPELGEGFILKCLQYYDFKVDRVVNSLLEDNLAESLRGLDRTLPIIPEDLLDNKFLETGVERLNIFDGDAFDIMSRNDIDTSKIHVGKKKSKYKDAKDLLNDKSDMQKIRERYNKYNMICAEEDALYDDEYDDAYDSDGAGPAMEPVDDFEERRPFVTPRALQRGGGRAEKESESSSEEEQQSTSFPSASTSPKNRMNFCVNPEMLRARREASFQARRGKGHRVPPPPKNTDVVGKPKGQGQEKEVLHNRERKEKNKSSRGNHNRRQGAQWKRTQGMMPS